MSSETVQAAQRLEISGTVVRMGGMDVPRLQIESDAGVLLEVSNVDPALLASMPMLLYKRVRLVVEAETDPAPAAAPEDAERAAYLKRWAHAPEWAEWLSQDNDGRCDWWEVRPVFHGGHGWLSGSGEPVHLYRQTFHDLLGSVRCEPRPVPADGQHQSWEWGGFEYVRGPGAKP